MVPACEQGGVGRIAEELVAGLQEHGGVLEYSANVKEILTEGAGDAVRAVGVRLNDGRVIRLTLVERLLAVATDARTIVNRFWTLATSTGVQILAVALHGECLYAAGARQQHMHQRDA